MMCFLYLFPLLCNALHCTICVFLTSFFPVKSSQIVSISKLPWGCQLAWVFRVWWKNVCWNKILWFGMRKYLTDFFISIFPLLTSICLSKQRHAGMLHSTAVRDCQVLTQCLNLNYLFCFGPFTICGFVQNKGLNYKIYMTFKQLCSCKYSLIYSVLNLFNILFSYVKIPHIWDTESKCLKSRDPRTHV